MMNHWGNDQYMMVPHLMTPSMGMGPNMGPAPNMGGPALLPTPMQPPLPASERMVPPLAPPTFLLNEWNSESIPVGAAASEAQNSNSFIGPKKPIDLTQSDETHEKCGNENQSKSSREKEIRDGRKDIGDRDRDRGRRHRSPYRRDNRERRDRSRSDRRSDRRPQRWSDNRDSTHEVQVQMPMGTNMMMPGNNMMAYGNNIMMGQQQMEMSNMQNMTNMPNMMPNMQNMMPGMNMMHNMQNMPGMMNMGIDQNMMMMQINMGNQPICISCGILLPPLPNAPIQTRRERPPGCRTIFVGGLPHGVNEDAVREIFERFGVVSDVKIHKQGVCHVRFGSSHLVEQAFIISGYRFKRHDQLDNEATTVFIDYALNREDQSEFERNKRKRTPTPPRIEPYTMAAFSAVSEKIKSDTEFAEAAPTLAGWLERGECNKKNSNAFYSLIQASNNQIRRLYTEKMVIDEEFQNVRSTMREKFASVITQFEQVGKILSAAKMQRVSDHFTKQQRRNIDMWLKMTEDLENIKEEFNTLFDEEESDEKAGKGAVILKKYEELKVEYENLQYELEGYRNEAHLAKDEAERKFEKFKAHFIAQQALQNNQPSRHQLVFPPLPPPPPLPVDPPLPSTTPAPTPPVPAPPVSTSEAKLISVLTAFLLVHPLGATLDYLVLYVRSIIPSATHSMIHNTLQKYSDVFDKQMSGFGTNVETKWTFVTYDVIKKEMF